MRIWLCAVAALLLCSCATAPETASRASFSVNGQATPATDIYNPRFYLDDDRDVYVSPPTLQDQMLNFRTK